MSASKPSSDEPVDQPATATPRPAPKGQADPLDDDGEPWRHPPIAPKDQSPVDSFARAVTETVTGPLDAKRRKPRP